MNIFIAIIYYLQFIILGENLIETALKETYYAYNYLDEDIKNKEFIKKCIKINPMISTILSKKDKELLTVFNQTACHFKPAL